MKKKGRQPSTNNKNIIDGVLNSPIFTSFSRKGKEIVQVLV